MKPQISICIRCFNEEKFMKSKLNYLLTLLKTYEKARVEILIAIQGKDKSYQIASGFKNKFKRLRLFKLKPDFLNATNQLIKNAEGEIIIFDDADNLLFANLYHVIEIFKNKNVAAVATSDVANKEVLGDIQEMFSVAYDEVKLRHHLQADNSLDSVIFGTQMFRKSALREGKVETVIEEFEIPIKIMKDGYKFIYVKELIYHILNNPIQQTLTVSKILRRRIRTEKNREDLIKLDADEFKIKNRAGEFTEAIFLTFKMIKPEEYPSFIKYVSIISLATVYGKLMQISNKKQFIQIR